jgi:hypothetical protein
MTGIIGKRDAMHFLSLWLKDLAQKLSTKKNYIKGEKC